MKGKKYTRRKWKVGCRAIYYWLYVLRANYALGFLNKAEKKGEALFDESTEPTAVKSAFIEEVKDWTNPQILSNILGPARYPVALHSVSVSSASSPFL